MEVYCTRPGCPRPVNYFPDLDNNATLKTVQQKYCTTCGMPLILIGRYVPLRLLGRGGFGAAFLARDRYTPAMRQCVVKQFQPAGDLNPTQLKIAQDLFEREGEALEKLGNQHPLIPDLLAFFELDVTSNVPGTPTSFFYLVQEFIDGENLEDELARRGKFSEAEAKEILVEVLQILDFVHGNGAIHRDIKPSNIMRHRNGRIYLLDFGAVKEIASVAASSGAGKASTGIYSMGFAPPEQMSGNVVYPSTDLYALGVTCITLLSGKQPNELYDPYSNGWNWRAYAQVSDRLEAILNRMLLSSPNQRFQSAEEVLNALKAAPAPPPVTQPPAATGLGQVASAVQAAPPPKVAPTPTPAPVAVATPSPSAPVKAQPPAFSLVEILAGAAFTGFEGGLLAIALTSLLGTSLAFVGIWVALAVGILIFAQNRRWIERWDLIVIALISLGVVIFFPPLHAVFSQTNPGQLAFVLAILAGLGAVAVTILFQLIYRILSSLF